MPPRRIARSPELWQADRNARQAARVDTMARDDAAAVGGKSGALKGVKIVDLTRVLGGPFATQLLADHGADVIRSTVLI